ncbi:TetR family transcriptional regulator [Rhodococcus qingshengii]|uniref:TetR/AcrR family transcriptional regulator n=1 Tax=Rhodococcus qingshengii TaxID=334542 RepID=UPI0036D982B5
MNESANSSRGRRKLETARGLTRVARQLTTERGFSGFTIEEVCAEVGVSRRTFFNYFTSKEKAFFGISTTRYESRNVERFLAAGPRGAAALVDDLVALALGRWEISGLTAEDIDILTPAFEREPRLIGRLLELASEEESHDIELVQRREGWAASDLRAAVAVQLVGTLARSSVEEFLRIETDQDLPELMRSRLGALRELFS